MNLGLIGNPIEKSISPQLQKILFKELDLSNFRYENMRLPLIIFLLFLKNLITKNLMVSISPFRTKKQAYNLSMKLTVMRKS